MIQIFNEALEDILKHRTTSMLLASIIAISVFVCSVFLSLAYNLDEFRMYWSNNARIYVFTFQGVELEQVKKEISVINGVISVEEYAPEKAIQVLKEQFPSNELALYGDAVPAFLELNTNIANVDNVKGLIEKIEGVDEVVVNSSWFNSLSNIVYIVEYSAQGVILLLLFMALIMIAYASRIGVIERKPEIDLMRLCGATEWRLRTPYIWSGMILGFIGGGIGISAYVLLKSFMEGHSISIVVSNWKDLPLFNTMILYISAVIVGAMGNLVAFFRGSGD